MSMASQFQTLEQKTAQVAVERASMIEMIETSHYYQRTGMVLSHSLSPTSARIYSAYYALQYRGADVESSKLAARRKSEKSPQEVSKRGELLFLPSSSYLLTCRNLLGNQLC